MTHPDPTQKANLLFGLLDELPLEGYEASFKLMPHKFLKVRFLIGVQTKNISKHRFDNICLKMEMPDNCYTQCTEQLNESNIVLFGFEEDGNHCIYKIYLEFNDKNKSIVQQTKSKTPLVQYLGFKWDAFDNQKFLTTTYKWFPFISKTGMLDRLDGIYKKTDHFQLLLIKDLIQLGISRINDSFDPYIYLEATDMNRKRKSFDLNLYKAGLTMGQLEKSIIKTMHFFEIDTRKWQAFLWKIRNKAFGHISGGYSSSGDMFLSFYYDVFSGHRM